MDIIELVSTALESLNVITIYGWYDDSLNKTHITFLEFDSFENDYADDEAEIEEHYITVDSWTKDVIESQSLKKQIKMLMKQNDFKYQDGADQTEVLEDGSILYHVTTRWLMVENLE